MTTVLQVAGNTSPIMQEVSAVSHDAPPPQVNYPPRMATIAYHVPVKDWTESEYAATRLFILRLLAKSRQVDTADYPDHQEALAEQGALTEAFLRLGSTTTMLRED